MGFSTGKLGASTELPSAIPGNLFVANIEESGIDMPTLDKLSG